MFFGDNQLIAIVTLICLLVGLRSMIGLRSYLYNRHVHGRQSGFGAFAHIHQRVESAIAEFEQELNEYRQRRDLLNVYTPEYFNTLRSAGWEEFGQLLEDLRYAENALESLMEAGEFEEADFLVSFLLGRLSPEETSRAERQFKTLKHLGNWRQQASQVILCIIKALEAAAQDTKELGIYRRRKRKPTLLAIDELQSILPK